MVVLKAQSKTFFEFAPLQLYNKFTRHSQEPTVNMVGRETIGCFLLSSLTVVAVVVESCLVLSAACCSSSSPSTADRTDTCCATARWVHRRAHRRCCCEFDWRRLDSPCIEHTAYTGLNEMRSCTWYIFAYWDVNRSWQGNRKTVITLAP